MEKSSFGHYANPNRQQFQFHQRQDTGTDQDMFFHNTALEGVSFEELREGQRVSYTEGEGPKGPQAENVTLA
jgi:CspA family cold shock protein